MKLKNDYGITLIILVITVVLMLILLVVSVGSFNSNIFDDLEQFNENAEKVRTLQDREAQNAIDGLGGLD